MDEYSRLSRNASVGVHGYVMVYSINNKQSFTKVRSENTTRLKKRERERREKGEKGEKGEKENG